MDITISEIKELDNGGAELIVNLDEETTRFLINYAVIDILKKNLAEVKELWDGSKAVEFKE